MTRSVSSIDAESFLLQPYWKTEQHHKSGNIDFSHVVHGKKIVPYRCKTDIRDELARPEPANLARPEQTRPDLAQTGHDAP